MDVDVSISFSVVSVDASGRSQDISLRVRCLYEYCLNTEDKIKKVKGPGGSLEGIQGRQIEGSHQQTTEKKGSYQVF